jgi:hypothetical protein
MKKNLEIELTTRYIRYLELVKSYCEVVGIRYVVPTVSQFLEANALTRDRLMVAEPNERKPVDASGRKRVTEAKKMRLLSFATYLRHQDVATK